MTVKQLQGALSNKQMLYRAEKKPAPVRAILKGHYGVRCWDESSGSIWIVNTHTRIHTMCTSHGYAQLPAIDTPKQTELFPIAHASIR